MSFGCVSIKGCACVCMCVCVCICVNVYVVVRDEIREMETAGRDRYKNKWKKNQVSGRVKNKKKEIERKEERRERKNMNDRVHKGWEEMKKFIIDEKLIKADRGLKEGTKSISAL